MAVIVSAHAHEDEQEAVRDELLRSPERAVVLIDALQQLYERLEAHPELYPVWQGEVRRAVLVDVDRSVFYRLAHGDVYILRIFHVRSDPQRWPSG